jgi:serine/threonine protein kinase
MRKTRDRSKSSQFDPQQPPEIPGVTSLTLIGGGGSASVYKGHEPAMRRAVAVKILHAQLRAAKERQVFEGECERAGQAGEHPYAADVYRNGFAGDWPFIVMRYYARGSMAAAGFGRQPVGETLTICANVATALQYAHNLGILHRDVKPENILCDAYGDPVLADFGISTDRDAATRTLRHAMTPAYAAPEVLQHGGGWPHSDVWSLAATLYALLAGRPPWYDPRHGDPMANLRALTGPLPPLGRPDVPEHVSQTLARALIGRPDTRTASARRFAEELNGDLRLLGFSPVPIRVDGDAPPVLPVPPAPAPVSGTSPGLTTTTLPPGGYPPQRDATHPPQAYPGSPQVQYVTTNGTPAGQVTGYMPTDQAYRAQEPPAEQRTRKPMPKAAKAAAAAGGAAVLAILAVAYLLAAPKHPAAGQTAPTASAPATPSATGGGNAGAGPAGEGAGAAGGGNAAGGAAGGGAAAVAPPADVTAVAVSQTTVRLSWKNTGPHASDANIIVSMGAGHKTRVLLNQSPQLITGLNPVEPYCFAVGYYITSGEVAYSKVTAKACIRGGTPQ